MVLDIYEMRTRRGVAPWGRWEVGKEREGENSVEVLVAQLKRFDAQGITSRKPEFDHITQHAGMAQHGNTHTHTHTHTPHRRT